MHAMFPALMLAALAQLGGRYDGAASDPPATDAPPIASPAADSAAQDGGPPVADAAAEPDLALPPSEISIAGETPQPTLAEDATNDASAVESAAEPTVAPANPFDAPAAEVATAGDADANAAAQPETSVLINGPRPAELMRTLLAPPRSGQLPGVPITLGDAVRGAATRSEQNDRARAYWDLAAAVAQYYLAVLENAELPVLRQAVAAPSAAWNSTADDFARRLEHTRQSATAAQLRLHRLMGDAAGASLPLPADLPHCGRYNTRFDEIFAGRQDPAAAQLNYLLPLLQTELMAGARLVAEANDWLTFVSERREPTNDGTGLLYAYELFVQRRQAFVEAARQYNMQIVAYTELAAPDEIGPDRLVSMLIRVSNPGRSSTGESGEVQPASAVDETAGQGATNGASNEVASQQPAGAKRTFARRPLERLRLRERSIVTVRKLLRFPEHLS
jgi:hypothetical protein